ncbi:MAG TPA: hypothetical protein VMG81_06725 [Thermoplasmata archaeon]|nr:hypothetical protein [Thermoplasmata archaeon]
MTEEPNVEPEKAKKIVQQPGGVITVEKAGIAKPTDGTTGTVKKARLSKE